MSRNYQPDPLKGKSIWRTIEINQIRVVLQPLSGSFKIPIQGINRGNFIA